jgi:predicted nucleic acid-binding protein
MNAVDTNVLLYAKDPRDPRKQKIAETLLATMTDGAMLWQVGCEFLSASRKLEQFGYSLSEAWVDLEDLRSTWTTVLPRWEVQEHAVKLTQRYSISYWDALIVSSCHDAGIARLYSEDLDTHNGLDGLEIVNPFRDA